MKNRQRSNGLIPVIATAAIICTAGCSSQPRATDNNMAERTQGLFYVIDELLGISRNIERERDKKYREFIAEKYERERARVEYGRELVSE